MPAARRFTATRTCTTAMRPNASAAADRNTNALTTSVLSAPAISLRNSKTASMSDPEIAHLEHEDVAEHHPCAGEREAHLGETLIPDAGVEVGRDEIKQKEDHDRQAGEKQRRELALCGERLDLAPHLEALADYARQVRENFGQVATGRALDRNGGHKQRQVFLPDAEVEVAHRGLDIGAVGDLVGRDAKLGPDRIRQFLCDEADRHRYRMPGAQRAHDDVHRVRKLSCEFVMAPLAHEQQRRERQSEAGKKAGAARFGEFAAELQNSEERAAAS